MFCSNHVFLRLALSVRTTPKGTGAFLEIQASSVLIVLRIISLLIAILFQRDGELKIGFANYAT